jgi:hypothetical protein
MKARIAPIVLAVLFAFPCFSAPPAGTFTLNFPASNGVGLWDFTGDYVIVERIASVDIALTFSLVQDSKGRLTGTGIASFTEGEQTFVGELNLSGNVKSQPADLNVKLSGKVESSPESPPFTANVQLPLKLNSLERTLFGTMNCKLKVEGAEPLQLKGPVSTALPESATGDWSITFVTDPGSGYNPDDDENDSYSGHGIRMHGDAIITLSSGQTFEFSGPGIYSEKGIHHFRTKWDYYWGPEIHGWEVVGPRETKLKLNGAGSGGANNLVLQGYGNQFDLIYIIAKVGGQRASFP